MLVAAASLVEGDKVEQAAKRAGISRTTLWRWQTESTEEALEFRRILTDLERHLAAEVAESVVAEAKERLRSLAPQAIQAFEVGLAADSEIIVRLRAADLVTKRIAELMPKAGVDVAVSGTLEARIREWRERGIEPPD
jgi:transposase